MGFFEFDDLAGVYKGMSFYGDWEAVSGSPQNGTCQMAVVAESEELGLAVHDGIRMRSEAHKEEAWKGAECPQFEGQVEGQYYIQDYHNVVSVAHGPEQRQGPAKTLLWWDGPNGPVYGLFVPHTDGVPENYCPGVWLGGRDDTTGFELYDEFVFDGSTFWPFADGAVVVDANWTLHKVPSPSPSPSASPSKSPSVQWYWYTVPTTR